MTGVRADTACGRLSQAALWWRNRGFFKRWHFRNSGDRLVASVDRSVEQDLAEDAQFVAVRVTPVGLWRHHQRLADVWLLCQRPTGTTTATAHDRYFVSNLPATTSLRALVRAAHQRWAIEQQYQELKTELGFDHFEGRSYPGWQHHVVITAIAYAFLQKERMRPRAGPRLTLPQVRAIVQEIFTGLLFISRPRYMHWMRQAETRFHQLRI